MIYTLTIVFYVMINTLLLTEDAKNDNINLVLIFVQIIFYIRINVKYTRISMFMMNMI